MGKTKILWLLAFLISVIEFTALTEVPKAQERLPYPGLYDPVTRKSRTTGDPYPTFLDGMNQIPLLNPERTQIIDNVLTILIKTPDRDTTYSSSDFDTLLFSEGLYPTGSLHEYFREVSYGKFGLTGEVAGWFVASNPYSYYTDNKYGLSPKIRELVVEAVNQAEEAGVDFSKYDNDGDGWVDGLIIIHQGPGAEFTGSADDIWSHRWYIEPVKYDNVWISDYSMNPELAGDGSSGEIEHISVLAHEYTHLLGIPDLYDYDKKLDTSTYNNWGDENDHPLMDWCLMGYGGYGLSSYGKGRVPSHLSGYVKYLLGWIEPVTLSKNQKGVTVNEVETTNVNSLYKIPINGSAFEYFLIENRNSASSAMFDHYDSDFSAWFTFFTPGRNPLDAGLIIYHVDEEMPLNNGTPEYDHYGITVEDAGFDPDRPWDETEWAEFWYPWEFKIGAAFSEEDGQNELTPLTHPNTDGYYGPSGIWITNISPSGSQMTFDLSFRGNPLYQIAIYRIEDSGDADGYADPGETAYIRLWLKNIGNGILDTLYAKLISLTEEVAVLDSIIHFRQIPLGEIVTSKERFSFEVSGEYPSGSRADFLIYISNDSNYTQIDTFSIITGMDVIFQDDMEGGEEKWSHGSVTSGYVDQWHISEEENSTEGGSRSWKCGGDEGSNYAPRLDSGLETGYINVPAGAKLKFWHSYKIEEGWDGAIVEIFSNDQWTQIYPQGGYPGELSSASYTTLPPGTPCYTGYSGWKEEIFDLASYNGNIKLRFRMVSDNYVGNSGWFLDDVSIISPESETAIFNDDAIPVAEEFKMFHNFPNPFNSKTVIKFALPEKDMISLKIFNIKGEEIKTLIRGVREKGLHSAVWDGTNRSGALLSSGLYLYRLEFKGRVKTGKMLLIK